MSSPYLDRQMGHSHNQPIYIDDFAPGHSHNQPIYIDDFAPGHSHNQPIYIDDFAPGHSRNQPIYIDDPAREQPICFDEEPSQHSFNRRGPAQSRRHHVISALDALEARSGLTRAQNKNISKERLKAEKAYDEAKEKEDEVKAIRAKAFADQAEDRRASPSRRPQA
jgi:hypothetical protein